MRGDQLVSFTKITKLDGEEKNFLWWKMKVKSITTLKGVCKALQPNFKNEMLDKFDAVLQDTDVDEKKRRVHLRRTIWL